MWDSRSALCHWLVAAAARGVGMTRASAYRRRDREGAESFAAAWDRVLTPPGSGHLPAPKQDFRKVTLQELIRRLETDLVQPVIYRRWMCTIRRKPDNSALFRLLQPTDGLVDTYGLGSAE